MILVRGHPNAQFQPGIVPVELIFVMLAPICMIIEMKKKVPACYYVSLSFFVLRLIQMFISNIYFWQEIKEANIGKTEIPPMLKYIYLMLMCQIPFLSRNSLVTLCTCITSATICIISVIAVMDIDTGSN